jgi:hypothetical protein
MNNWPYKQWIWIQGNGFVVTQDHQPFLKFDHTHDAYLFLAKLGYKSYAYEVARGMLLVK